VKVSLPSGKSSALPSIRQIADLDTQFSVTEDYGFNLDSILRKFKFRDHIGAKMFSRCSVAGCFNTDIQIHHERKLHRSQSGCDKFTVVNKHGRRVQGLSALLSSMNRKQLPLCSHHHLELNEVTSRTLIVHS
jgi:hypothetical protein